jgi:hypothetical protein
LHHLIGQNVILIHRKIFKILVYGNYVYINIVIIKMIYKFHIPVVFGFGPMKCIVFEIGLFHVKFYSQQKQNHFFFFLTIAWFKWVQAFATLAFIFTIATVSSLAVAVFSSFRWQWKYQLIWSITAFLICKCYRDSSFDQVL